MKFLFCQLIFFTTALLPFEGFASNLIAFDDYRTHKRLSLHEDKSKLLIDIQEKSLIIKTLDFDIYEKIIDELKTNKKLSDFLEKIISDTSQYPQGPAIIKITFNRNNEIFKFYRDIEKKFIIDIWEKGKKESVARIKKRLSSERKFSKNREIPNKVISKKNVKNSKKNQESSISQDKILKNQKKNERDFRYGAPIIIAYPEMAPKTAKTIDIRSKAADFLYKIPDLDFNRSDSEAHAQLTINLFKKGKFGLMGKSIKLYNDKYGNDKNEDLFNFLKATSIIKNAILKNEIDKKTGDHKMAYAIYEEVASKTSNYRMKKAIYQYLIEQKNTSNSYIDSLRLSKKLYVDAKVNFDKETELLSIEKILYSLAMLSQVEDIEKLLNDKSVRLILPKQLQQAYRVYGLMKEKKYKEVVRVYKDKKTLIKSPVDASLLFNIAESMFQEGRYQEAINLFDQFVVEHSSKKESTYGRMRIALSYDLMGEDIKKVAELYKEVINKSWINEVSYEAKIRYVATMINRKKELSKDDDLIIGFLNRKEKDKNVLENEDMKKLLWLVRLRVFINKEQYSQALMYLKSIPLTLMNPIEKKVFIADASEIIHGMIKKSYIAGDYGKIIKLWQKHERDFFTQVPLNLSVNFMVAYAYLQLGLFSSSNQIINQLESYQGTYKSFPNWVEPIGVKNRKHLIAEIHLLKSLKEENWEDALAELIKIEKKLDKFEFYYSKVNYYLEEYSDVISVVEDFLINKKEDKLKLSHLEIYELFTYYLDSLYKKNKDDKFIKSAIAILDDVNRSKEKTQYLMNLKERTLYLLIEMLDKNDKKNDQYENYMNNFLISFDKSVYKGRIKYLLGKYYLDLKNDVEGEKIFNEIIKSEETPSYIKELAKSELSTLKIERQGI